jgi:hypothetical protein
MIDGRRHRERSARATVRAREARCRRRLRRTEDGEAHAPPIIASSIVVLTIRAAPVPATASRYATLSPRNVHVLFGFHESEYASNEVLHCRAWARIDGGEIALEVLPDNDPPCCGRHPFVGVLGRTRLGERSVSECRDEDHFLDSANGKRRCVENQCARRFGWIEVLGQ